MKLKVEESSSYLKFIRINDGTFKKKNRKSKDVQRDLLIQTAKFNLINNNLDIQDYLIEVSKVVQDFEVKKKNKNSTASTSAVSSSTSSLPNSLDHESDNSFF